MASRSIHPPPTLERRFAYLEMRRRLADLLTDVTSFIEGAASYQGTLDRFADHDPSDCLDCNGPDSGKIHGALVDADVQQIEALMLFARSVAVAVYVATDSQRLALVCAEMERHSMTILKDEREARE